MNVRVLLLSGLLVFGGCGVALSEEKVAVTEPVKDEVIAFLEKVEAKNTETESLQADFTQVRKDLLFDETIESKGTFAYKAPGKFHASYKSENDSEIWLVDNKMISYIPSMKQVEIIQMGSGESAPINQLLLGFGVKVDRILKSFDVSLDPSADKGQVGVRFKAKDLDVSMGYELITVFFDEEKVEPRKIVLQDDQSSITVTLKKVKVNPEISDDEFKPSWPDDAEVLTYQ